MEAMRLLARDNDWKEYWQCFSTRGKAWYTWSFYYATALAAFSYPDKRPPEAFEAERLLEHYGLTKNRMERRGAETIPMFFERISHFLDGREVEFWTQIRSQKQWVLPGDGEIRILRETDSFAMLALPGGLEAGVIKLGGKWYFDGSEHEK